jgi:hypothetical protein
MKLASGAAIVLAASALAGAAAHAADSILLGSPGMPASRMSADGALAEDWGNFRIRLSGEGIAAPGRVSLTPTKLEGIVPAAQAAWNQGPVAATVTAFRAPAFPSGLDVVTVRIAQTADAPARVTLAIDLPPDATVGSRTISLGGRPIIALPAPIETNAPLREWGYADDAVALPGWATPSVPCDPAYRNIRAGMNGVPIHYSFSVERGAAYNVVLGLCESFHESPGRRPVVCQVEGAPQQEVDPIARWGRHKPGALLFEAKDVNGDGRLDITVLPRLGSPDTNPILNVIWIFPAGSGLNLDQVVSGRMNPLALRYVDVGGPGDQSLFAPGKAEYVLELPAKGEKELTFLVAAAGSSAPTPGKSAWTAEALRRAAIEVWRDWKEPPR